jgi:nucleotide-binding universal stress UspA family protein
MTMTEIHRILCPTDFSDFSRHALDHALAIAKLYHSTITLLHVCSVAPGAVYAPGIGVAPSSLLTVEDRDAALAAMHRFAETEAGADAPIEFEVAEGNATTEILDRARTHASDLIVMGTHGRSGFERLLLGSVTEKVLRKADCPVLSVPRRAPDVVPAQPVLFRDILCPVDFSDSSIDALQYAMSLAEESGARLTLVHVIELPPEIPIDEHGSLVSWPQSLREYVAVAEADRAARLKELLPEPDRSNGSVSTVLATGKAYAEILRIAAEQSTELIVIGIHGRRAADLLFLGSTTQHVLRHATCPVLTIRSR